MAFSSPSSNKENMGVNIPTTPNLKRIGYGTGVGVFQLDRSPFNGRYNSPWAIKKISVRCADRTITNRLSEEATVLRKLSHPNIVGFRAYTTDARGNKCLAMETCGRSLGEIIEEMEEAFEAHTITKVALEVAKGLDYMHNTARLLHGDVKSHNVLVKGDFEEIKLCDFGVTLPLNGDGMLNKVLAHGRSYVGTQIWSAPEVLGIDGTAIVVSDKADVFSYGLTIWEMMALAAPFLNDDWDESMDESTFQDNLDAKIGKRPEVPYNIMENNSYNKIVQLFIYCTEHDCKKRYSVKQVISFLNNV